MVYKALLARLIPERCRGCGAASAMSFCTGCRNELRAVERPCGRCGLSLPAADCPRETGYWHIDATVAPFAYAEPLQSYLRALKFSGQRHIGRALGELLADHLTAAGAAATIDALVAVPLHRRRLILRGYNQAVEIARPVAAALRLPLLHSGIGRPRATPAQTQLGAKDRRANPRGAFVVSRPLAGLRVAVIDDVMTTGATINVLARELLRAGAESVHAWAVARSL